MSSNMTAIFDTQYNGQGATAAKAGIRGVSDEVAGISTVSAATGTNFDSLFTKMERPLGRVAFHGLAQDMLMTQNAMGGVNGSTGVLAGTLHGLVNGLGILGGEFTMVAIGAIAVYEIYEKLFNKTQDVNKVQSDNAKSSADQSVEYAKVAEQLRGLGPQYEKAASEMEKHSASAKKDALEILSKENASFKDAGASLLNADATNKTTKATLAQEVAVGHLTGTLEDYNKKVDLVVASDKNLAKAKSQLTEREQQLFEVTKSVNALTDKSSKKVDTSAEKEVNDLLVKRADSMKKVSTLTSELAANQSKLSAATSNFMNAVTPIEKKYYADKIILLNKDIESENSNLSKRKTIEREQEASYKRQATSIDKYLTVASDSVTTHGKKIVFEGRKFLGEELEDAANQASSWLLIQAAKYFGAGNYAMAALAAAGAITVKELGAIGAAALDASAGGDTSDTSAATTTPSTSTATATSPSATTASSQPNTNLTIVVQGPNLVNETDLSKRIVELANVGVNRLGLRLGSTSIVTANGGGVY